MSTLCQKDNYFYGNIIIIDHVVGEGFFSLRHVGRREMDRRSFWTENRSNFRRIVLHFAYFTESKMHSKLNKLGMWTDERDILPLLFCLPRPINALFASSFHMIIDWLLQWERQSKYTFIESETNSRLQRIFPGIMHKNVNCKFRDQRCVEINICIVLVSFTR